MKVQVSVKTGVKGASSNMLELTVDAAETVVGIKERVAALQLIPFPEQDLIFNGRTLGSHVRLSDCGVKEGSALELVVKASEEKLLQQLSELLQARDLSPDELGLLYCYKHGVSANQALKFLGSDASLQDFITKQKSLLLENGRVTLIRQDTALKPFSAADELVKILETSDSGSMEIKELSSKFIQKFNVSITSITGSKAADFLNAEQDKFSVSGRTVSLKSAKVVAPKMAVDKPTAPPGLENCAPVEKTDVAAVSSQQYIDLHDKICSRAVNSRVVQALNDVEDALRQSLCFNIDHVAKGGSVGKGTAIAGITDAEMVFFLQGLPPTRHEKWLPPLLKAAAGVLREQLAGNGPTIDNVVTTEDSVRFSVNGLMNVDVRFSPFFKTYSSTVQALGAQGPSSIKFFQASIAKERAQFISKQPGQVKVTMRLMKWWRDQQEWSSKISRPKDEILELMAIYSAVQTKPSDQRMAIANVMSLLSRFNELRVVWSNFYTKSDVWSPLMSQRPLLMDPVNPFVNVADPQSFDCRELMTLAKNTHFFW